MLMRGREWVRLSVLSCLQAWTAYAAVECLFSSVLPLIVPLVRGYSMTNDGFTVAITLFYLVFGAFCGAVIGLLSWPLNGRFAAVPLLRSLGTLSVAVAVLANFRYYGPPMFPVVVAALWAGLILLSGVSRVWSGPLTMLTNPWTTCLMLIGPEWLYWEVLDMSGTGTRIAVECCYLVAVLLLTIAVFRVRIRMPAIAMTAALGIVLTAAMVLDERVGIAAVHAATPPPMGRPNVILITLDTVRADHLSLYGYGRRTTPNLDAFARECVVYREAVSAGDMTLSSHASIFTGLYPSRHNAHPVETREVGYPLGSALPSLPEILEQKGYRTMAVLANYAYLSPYFGLSRGFERYDVRAAVPFLAEARPFYLRARVRNFATRRAAPADFERQTRTAEEINHEAFTLLEELRNGKAPFFVFLNYMDAHWPYLPPAPYDRLYPGKAARFTGSNYSSMNEEVSSSHRDMTPGEHNHLISQYDGALNYLDDQLGKLIARLKELGLLDNTLLIIASDHGESFGERRLFQHGVSVYEDQVHVPLLIRFPQGAKAQPPGTSVARPVSLVDLLPTILDVLHYPAPAGIAGRSLLTSAPDEGRTVFAESYPSSLLVQMQPRLKRVERAAYSGDLKLVSSTAGKRELFDLAKDPRETSNLYTTAGAQAEPLEASLSAWLRHTVPAATSQTPQADAGAVDRLRSLGYVQ